MSSALFRKLRSARLAFRWRRPSLLILLAFRQLLSPVFRWYIWRLFEVDISRPTAQPYTSEKLDSKVYDSADAAAAWEQLAAMGHLSSADVNCRFARGHLVVIAFREGRPVGCTWLALADGAQLEFDTYWIIRPGEAMKYGVFVLPEYRGRAIHSFVSYSANCHLRSIGVTRSLSVISIFNTPSMSLAKHFHRRSDMTIFLARIRGLNWTFRKSFGAPLESRFFWTAPRARQELPQPDSSPASDR